MSSWLYHLQNYYPLEGNVRRTSSIVYAQRERLPEYEPDPDDMDNLKPPNWWDEGYEPPEKNEQEDNRQRPPQERNWAEDDYYSNLEYERSRGHDEYHYPDMYSWDQFAPQGNRY